MTPEQQQKYDEKEAKRKLKAKQAKVKVVYSWIVPNIQKKQTWPTISYPHC